jgi:hypothetical protein
LYNPRGLHWRVIFNWLLKHADTQTILVMFAGHYDVNMWLKKLSPELRDSIFSSEETEVEDYVIFYIPKKFFRIKKGNKKVIVYDTFSFFNCSFVAATKKVLGFTPRIISQQKKLRATFSLRNIKQIKEYNRQECILLVQMMEKLRAWIKPLDINLRGWYGPSALANTYLGSYKINEEYPDFRYANELYSAELFDAFNRAYFGGRIEAFKLGTVKNVYQYDINSAYPFSMTFLQPTLLDWLWTRQFKADYQIAVYHVKWNLKRCDIGLFPFRDHNKGIYFPKQGEGWYWYPEIKFALDHFPKDVEIMEGYYQRNSGASLIASLIGQCYEARQGYKKSKNPTEYILKIMMNSMYGKFAQTVGKPRFTNMVWAGYITSFTRSQLLAATWPHFDELIAFSTDGILTTKKLDLKLSNLLGEWNVTKYDQATVFMPGVYQLFKAGESTVRRRRGYRVLEYDKLIRGLNRNHKVDIPVRFFVTHNLWRAQSNVLKNKLCTFVDITKEFNPYSNQKRTYFFDQIKQWELNFCGSTIIQSCKSKISEPYEAFKEFDESVTEDDL